MIKEFTHNDFDTEISQKLPVVVEFYTSTCSHCKRLAKTIDQLSDELSDKAVFAKVNIETQTFLQAQYDITAVPTLLFIKNGEIRNKLVGEIHPMIIQEEIKKLY